MVVGVEPNNENKLFVGGCPSSSGEEDLRELFEKHGVVEEVFVMRGGSRSGNACAFVRFSTQAMAQQAMDAIHGRITLPSAAEPLVVRWADAPGSRKKDGKEGGRGGKRNGGGARDIAPGMEGWGMMQMHNQLNGLYANGYPHLAMGMGPLEMQQQAMGMGQQGMPPYYSVQHPAAMSGSYGPQMQPVYQQMHLYLEQGGGMMPPQMQGLSGGWPLQQQPTSPPMSPLMTGGNPGAMPPLQAPLSPPRMADVRSSR